MPAAHNSVGKSQISDPEFQSPFSYLQFGAYEWILSQTYIQNSTQKLGGRLMTAPYTELTSQPSPVLKQIAGFLEVDPYEKWILRGTRSLDARRVRGVESLFLPPNMCAAFNQFQEQLGFKNRAQLL